MTQSGPISVQDALRLGNDLPDSQALSSRTARHKDACGYPAQRGEPVKIGGETWYIPERGIGIHYEVKGGTIQPMFEAYSDEESRAIDRMLKDGDAESCPAYAALGLLLAALRINYDLTDEQAQELFNRNVEESHEAARTAMDLRLIPDTRRAFAIRLLQWAANVSPEALLGSTNEAPLGVWARLWKRVRRG